MLCKQLPQRDKLPLEPAWPGWASGLVGKLPWRMHSADAPMLWQEKTTFVKLNGESERSQAAGETVL